MKKFLVKIIYKLDKIFLGGKIKRMRNIRKEKERIALERWGEEHPEEYYDRQTEINLNSAPIIGLQTFSVKDILLAQFVDGEGVFYDIAVRLLAIEQYYGKNDIGYDFYARMQENAGNGSFWLQRFIKLIQSYESRGFDKTMPIDVDENFLIMDGAHRLSLAIYHNEEYITARIHNSNLKRRWNYQLFAELGFSNEELMIIHNKAIELYVHCKYQYVGVIWPSAYHLKKEIVEDVNSYLKKAQYPPLQIADCEVVKYEDLCMNEMEFVGFFRAMYFADSMTEDGIQRKLKYISDSLPSECKDFPIRILYFEVRNPMIGRNEINNTARSMQIARIKKVIRNRYKDRILKYEYDNIMHISDNYQQSKLCDYVIRSKKRIEDMQYQLQRINDYIILNE